MDLNVKTFLEAVSNKILQETSDFVLAKMDGRQFQTLVTDIAMKLNTDHNYGLNVRPTSRQSFPDLIVNRTGIEIKATVKDHWITTGNSISETRREKDIDEIVFFFGKLGGKPQILIRPYSDCLASVVVTHNPRYLVNMRLSPEDSIFSKMGISYEDFRNHENPIKFVRDYVKKNLKPGEELWWIGDSSPEEHGTPVLRNFSSDNSEERRLFLVLAFALRPEVISNSTKKYNRLPILLLKHFGAVSPSMRDFFSAGGTSTVYDAEGNKVIVSAAHNRLLELAKQVKQIILETDEGELKYGWGVDNIAIDRIEQYCEIISKIARDSKVEYDLGELFLVNS